jgi:phosphoadenosine phosphosulfate reductase|nr:MAG TPA: phosphoadenosine-phosphosulfate reductase [Caudoviricetes sp.]
MEEHVRKSIDLIRKLETDQVYNLGFSGGKDSVVLLDLAKKSGVKFEPVYSNTTIDPPGTIPFIRDNYPEVKIVNPKESFLQLVARKGFPSRQRRFCCEVLKESYGIGKRNLEGMRRDESSNRSGYEPEQCDSRKSMKGACHVLPIVFWTEKQVWEYIHKHGLPYMKYYDAPYNFTRHGCVGCPLATKPQMRIEFKTFPRYAINLMRAIKKFMESHPNTFWGKNFDNEYEAFYYYINDLSLQDFKFMKTASMFKNDFKRMVMDFLNVDKTLLSKTGEI